VASRIRRPAGRGQEATVLSPRPASRARARGTDVSVATSIKANAFPDRLRRCETPPPPNTVFSMPDVPRWSATPTVLSACRSFPATLRGVATMPVFQTKSSRDSLAERLATNMHIYPLAGSGQRLHCVDGDGSVTDELTNMLAVCSGARLVIADPLRRFHAGEENDSAHMSAVVAAFEHLARRTGAAVILSHHANRSSVAIGTGDQASAARGSSALTDGVRWQANLSVISDRMAVQFPVANAERHLYVQLDVAKANYMTGKESVVLRRNPASGALAVWTPAMADGRRSRAPSGAVGKTRRTRGVVQ